MHKTVKNLLEINHNVKLKLNDIEHKIPRIIAVSKTFSKEDILPLIQHGHRDFGENKVQEAVEKWTDLKKKNEDIKLHMIGKLQTNKVKYVIPLFDYIHSLDSIKLAEKISEEQKKNNKYLKIFIQVNIGNEKQKSGIEINELNNFNTLCKKKLELDVIGLMCIPPQNLDAKTYFVKMRELSSSIGLEELSMGMSNDYIDAIACGASFVRVGSNIFGKRS